MYQIQILWTDMCGSFWTPADDNYKWAWPSYEEAYNRLCNLHKQNCSDYRIAKI